MKRSISFLTICLFLLSTIGCATHGQPAGAGQSAGIGALLGSAGGALIGAAVGGKDGALKGALIGAVAGGVTGFVVGNYREKQYKSAEQVYKENPQYAQKKNANIPPRVANIQPYINDSNGNKTSVIKNGEKIELGTKYDILVPQYSQNKKVEVFESNYLIDPSGIEMNKDRTKRIMSREAGGIDAGVEITIPKNLPDGTYTHVATATINNETYQNQQKIQIVRLAGDRVFVALR
jgi:hypothetical protein